MIVLCGVDGGFGRVFDVVATEMVGVLVLVGLKSWNDGVYVLESLYLKLC
jgi:hypothetical protein